MGPCETAGRDVGLVTQLQRAGDTLRAVQAATARGHSGRPLVCIQKSIRASEEVSQALEVCLRPRPCSHEALLLRVESRERCRVATARIDELGALRAASRAQRIQTQSACGIQVGMWSALGAGSATGQHRDSHPQRFRKVMPEMREWRVRQGHVRVDPFVQQDRHTAQLERIIQPERLDCMTRREARDSRCSCASARRTRFRCPRQRTSLKDCLSPSSLAFSHRPATCAASSGSHHSP